MVKRTVLAGVFIVALLIIAGVFRVQRYQILETRIDNVPAVWVVDNWSGKAKLCFLRPVKRIATIGCSAIERITVFEP